jgi:hypothetical protein
MKHLTLLVSAIILTTSFTSCTKNQENNDRKTEIVISIDSTIVDSKGEIIDTKYGLNTYDFDENKKFIYRFNTNNRHGIEVIDLDKMELVNFIPFEVEGPNGTTNRVADVHYISKDKIAVTNAQSILIFNMNAELQHKYPISSNEFEGDSIPKDFLMESSGLYLHDKKLSINLINKGFGYVRGFSTLNLEDNTQNNYWIDDLKKLDDYHISLTIDGRMMMLRTYLYTLYNDGKYFLSNDMLNELYYYDLKNDSIIHKEFKSKVSANKNEFYGKDVESREEIGEIMTARNRGIRFKNFVYDDTRNQYYRFSSFSTTPDQEKQNWNIILTALDANLNQLYEIENIALDEVPETYFVKDGKIYIYKNMEDEMGFIIIELSS